MPTSPQEPSHPGFPLNKLQYSEHARLLPDLNRLLLTHSDVREAFPRICRRLHRVLAHQHATIALYEPEFVQFRLYADHSHCGGSLPGGLLLPLEKTPYGEVYRSRRPIVVDDLRSPQFACEATQELLKSGHRSGCWAPLQTSDRILGALSISSGRPGAYRYDDAYLLNEVAGQICLALATHLGLEQLKTLQRQLDDEIHDWNRSFRDIAATALCGIVQWGESGIISDANDAFLRIVGRTRKDIDRGLNCSDLASDGASLRLQLQAEAELSERGSFKPFQQEYLRPDRTRSRVLVSAGLLNQRQPPWLALVVDLSAEPDVILSPGSELYIDLDRLQATQPRTPQKGSTLHEIEREHIARVLHDTKGVVGGEHGAASILGIKRTTLQYRMKKLEIPHR